MKRLKLYVKFAVILSSVAFLLGGCAAIERSNAIDTERLLAAAGFQMRFADTTERQAHLKTMPQRKLVPYNRNGKVYYVYADSLACECLYVGSEKAYQRYQSLAIQQKIAEENRAAAEMNANAAMNWQMWGSWYRPWY
ncbi:MAG: hypothetical protein U9N82_12835 [Thermodesulfobacteriota bacterium]|nr:hypothetical protein [Thermodesulfobacteriota bacterium]